MIKKFIPSFCASLFLLFIVAPATAEIVVRLEIEQDSIVEDVFLKLFDNDAPLTVSNFLNYVDDGDYNSSFFHRSVTDFIVQSGGFTFDPNVGSFSNDPLLNNFPGGLQPVPKDAPVPNEPGRSNLRGTVAMAKLSGDANSATSEWFVNLADNSANLDHQNGGFTVFGEVLDTGMDVFDSIAAQPVFDRTDIHSAFGTLPLTAYTFPDPVQRENLIQINRVNEVFSITPDLNFGQVALGSNLQPVIKIKNTGVDDLLIGTIGAVTQADSPFRVFGGPCTNRVLQQGQECGFVTSFRASEAGLYTDKFIISFSDLNIDYEFTLTAEGIVKPDEPDISIVSGFGVTEFGNVDIINADDGVPYESSKLIQNTGDLALIFSSFLLEGPDKSEFGVSGDCLDITSLDPGSTCTLNIQFSPLTTGEKASDLLISSNDPDENPFIMEITGNAMLENDGVPPDIEDAGPNGGDGNNDGIPDSAQSNIVSLEDLRGSYVTLVSTTGLHFRNVKVSDQTSIGDIPVNENFASGVFDFSLEGDAPFGIYEIGLILPAGNMPVSFYLYGPTNDNAQPHWYSFGYDGLYRICNFRKCDIDS